MEQVVENVKLFSEPDPEDDVETKNLFWYRNAETWLRSGLIAYGRGVGETDEERRSREKQGRGFLGSLVAAIAQYDPKQPRKRVITELELEELHWHVRHHAFIHEADFEVPNTLEI